MKQNICTPNTFGERPRLACRGQQRAEEKKTNNLTIHCVAQMSYIIPYLFLNCFCVIQLQLSQAHVDAPAIVSCFCRVFLHQQVSQVEIGLKGKAVKNKTKQQQKTFKRVPWCHIHIHMYMLPLRQIFQLLSWKAWL